MFKNHIFIALRSLRRFRLFTFLNIFGLGTGMACSILIFLWVQDETSYDKFNDRAAQIYRLTVNIGGTPAAVTPPPVLTALKQQIPAISAITRVAPVSENISIGNQKFGEKNILYADANFLQFFNYPLLEGDAGSVLSQPDGAVTTEATAIKFFGKTDVIGRVIHIDNDVKGNDYRIKGVLKDIPHNSHLQFGVLLSIDFYERSNGQVWDNFAMYSYVKLNDQFKATDASVKQLEKQTDAIYRAGYKSDMKLSFSFQPLTDIHLHSKLAMDVDGQGNIQYVRIFFLVAVFIVLLACINFMNLYTALGTQRAKEVGLRKTIGAMRSQLVTQFITESMLVALFSLMIGCAFAYFLLPVFNELAAKHISFDLLNFKLVGSLLALAVIVGIVSGSYPAFFMSSFNPVQVLKGLRIGSGRKLYLRNGLVVFQFAIAVILMISTIVVNYQLKFIRNRDVGFNKQNLLYIQMPQIGDLLNNYQALKAQFAQRPEITDYTFVDQLPTNVSSATNDVTWDGKNPDQQTLFPHMKVDGGFMQTFGMKLLAGRTFDNHTSLDQNDYIVNEKAVKLMGMKLENAVGQRIASNGKQGQIIGVVKDFNFKPVQQPIEPLIIRPTYRGGYVVLRAADQKLQTTLTELEAIFQIVYPNAPFVYGFVDQDLSKMYVAEQRMGVLFNTFSVISIIISCLGLFGLATFATDRRIKEIGVRRVLGADVPGIVVMLMKDFIRLVVFALVIAFPVAWYAMNNWLDNYAYRIELNWMIFVTAGSLAVLIALFTISYQSIRAALSNPVKSLRSE